jgi:large subunit ribosomal protein L22
MLSASKLSKLCEQRKVSPKQLAAQIIRAGLDEKRAVAAVGNWQKGLFKPRPSKEDINKLATALGVSENDISEWRSICRYAPSSPRKVHLVTQLIVGRPVQEAMDLLKFTHKRAASMVDKVLKSAVADADEQEANVDNLYVSEACVDDAGIQMGTKRFRAKDRGRAHRILQKASHIRVTVTEA